MSPDDINQTINMYTELSKSISFSRFSSILEISFMLNISYKLIPDVMTKIGTNKVKKLEDDTITKWELDKKGNPDSADKISQKIDTLKGIYLEDTEWSKFSSMSASWLAIIGALVSLVLLFFGSLEFCFLESNSYRVTIQTVIVCLLLLPNILALISQVIHWHYIKEDIEKTIERSNKK